jgi:hypothetical protein
MNPYVRLIKGVSYDFIKLLSYPALDQLLRQSLFQRRQILLPSIPPEEFKTLSGFERNLVKIYDAVKKTLPGRTLLYLFGPFFHAFCYADKPAARPEEARSHSYSDIT